MSALPQLFLPSLVAREGSAGLTFGGDELTFGALDKASNRLARRFLSEGLRAGDRVAVYLPNRPELIVAYLAAVKAGLVFTPINILYRAAEIEHILVDAEPRLLIAENAPAELPGSVGFLSADHIATWAGAESAGALGDERTPDDLAALVYTSGTTGRPKGAMLTHANFAANAEALVDAWRMTADDRLLLPLPLFHVHGLGNGLHTWLALGYHVRLLDRFRKESIVDVMLAYRPTVFFGVPTMYERLLATPPDAARAIGEGIRLFVSGSAPLPAATLEKFERRFGHRILERYGMSETLMNASNPYDGERRPGSVGPAMRHVEIRIANPESGQPAATGKTGELQIKGTNVFRGYWQREEATAEAFTEDGYFRSGDLGMCGEDGYITLQGRGKELIISGGFNVYPREIEEFLLRQDGVREAAVRGMPDPVKGEVAVAYVCGGDPSRLAAACRDNLASFKVPRRFVTIETLPRNALGKVQKHRLMLPEEVS